MQKEIQDLVDKSLKKARRLRATGNYGHAYAHYTAVVELAPDKRAEVEQEFTDVLCKWGMDLEKVDFDKTLLCYTRSLEIFPKNFRMLNNCAAHYLRQDCPREALPYLHRALTVNRDFLPAEWNLDYALNLLIDRWHFPMLNDRGRNVAYELAISNRINQGYKTVLDIGTGSGLLSLYAKDSGASSVYACEFSTEMSFIADRVFTKNRATSINLLPLHSTSIEIPRDLPQRVKLIVTETFDAGLFGERILSTLIHAHENLLAPNGIVVPIRATIFAAAVQSSHIRFISFADPQAKTCLNFSGIDIYSDNKNYDATSLNTNETIYITEPTELLTVNFNSLNELKELKVEGIKNITSAICKTSGTIDGLITWFKLELDDANVIDTSSADSCWQFAVFADKPVACRAGQELKIMCELWQEKLHCTYEFTKNSNPNWRKCRGYYFIPQQSIMYLNDNDYLTSIHKYVRTQSGKRLRFIFDASPFPFYGLEMLKHNPEIMKLYCYAETEQLGDLIVKIAELSSVDVDKIVVVESIEEVEHNLDVIFNHNFSIQGEINDWSEPSLYDALRLTLASGGVMLPMKILLIGQLVYSKELPKMVFIDDRNLQGSVGKSSYKIAEFFRNYGSRQRFDLDSTLYEVRKFSEERVLSEINEGSTMRSIVNFGKFEEVDGVVPNVLVCWYRIYLDEENFVASRRDNSFMNHSAIIFEEELRGAVERGEDVKFEVFQMKGLTRVSLVE